MSISDQVPETLERPDHIEAPREGGGFDRRSFLRRTAMTGVAAGSVSAILEACGSSASGGGSSNSIFGSHPGYKFVFVNHVTTNPFFTPTQYGIADACKLLGCSYQWTGSENSNVSQMVNAVNSAVAAKADGIAVALIDLHAFNSPVEKALAAGIPVIAYNADAEGNSRLAYVGQDLKLAGEKMGERIVEKIPSGEVALFIATPGSANLQPRVEGAEKVLKAKGITTHTVATGANVSEEQPAIEAFYKSHTGVKGMYSVDGGSTESLAKVMQKLGLKGKVHAGGFDLTEQTQNLIKAGYLEFTIDQQPYLQGFIPAMQMFFYKVSGTQTGPFEANTGLKFVTQETVEPYLAKSRFEGTTSSAVVVKA
ncbi:MAG TPA: sugar ABC transporter substrate-binding protein [Solirubrobacteraceae bacterium]|nr:sugar ABC transporter substrate-binding protein [Solirubrobacteraceae bacterium]